MIFVVFSREAFSAMGVGDGVMVTDRSECPLLRGSPRTAWVIG